jgi:RND family efflux transporter MFP subunit
MLKLSTQFVVALLLFSGCGEHSHDEETTPPKPEGGAVTLWTQKTELFMEHPALIVGSEAKFATHLSWMSDFKPVMEGTVLFKFLSSDGEQLNVTVEKPSSPGIYRPAINFQKPGTYRLTIILNGKVRDTIIVDDLTVFASEQDIPKSQEAPSSEQQISFLKEQQWKIDFRTEAVRQQLISETVRSVAEVIPAVNGEAIVAAPFTGYIPASSDNHLPDPGEVIQRGTSLAVIIPSAETPGGSEDFASRYTNAETQRDLAYREFERIKKLYAVHSISDKEYQEAEAALRRANTTFQSLNMLVSAEKDSSIVQGGFRLKAPISGTIAEMYVVPGKQVTAGDPLFRIINMNTVWIKASIAANDIAKIINPSYAWIRLAGLNEPIEINQRNGKLISTGSAIDERTRTIPVIFQRSNTEKLLRIGMTGEINISGNGKHQGLVIPQSALMEEEGRYSVYIHSEGESFVKRDVTLGAREKDRVEILKGVEEGERVVTVGAYQVRLASMSSQLPAHGHEH